MLNKDLKCAKCGSKFVVNRTYKLCERCNNIRLHGNPFGKSKTYTPPKPRKPLKRSKKPLKGGYIKPSKAGQERRKRNIEKDEEFYFLIFSSKPHECEECGNPLPSEFRDDDGKVAARWQYSHIVMKSIAPELRHHKDNCNRLCLKCHTKWEGADRIHMKIFAQNLKLWPQYENLLKGKNYDKYK